LAYLSELRGGFDLNIMHLPFVWAAVSPFFPPRERLVPVPAALPSPAQPCGCL